MRLLVAARNPSIFLQYERMFRALNADGHAVCMIFQSLEWRNARLDADLLASYRDGSGGLFEYRMAPEVQGFRATVLRHKRELVNYAGYLRDRHPVSTSPYMRDRAARGVYEPLAGKVQAAGGRRVLRSRTILAGLAALERLAPPSAVLDLVKGFRPDVVLASPFIFSRSEEIDYIKAARTLGIPSAVAVFSWDNLTSKGVFQVEPDLVLVWNKTQVGELETIHGVPPSTAVWTGAPSMDFWFDMAPGRSREAFCADCRLDAGRPFLVYLCSSQTIAPDEHVAVSELLAAIRARFGARTPQVLIRPHPLNLGIWEGFAQPDATVYPASSRDIFYSTEARRVFLESLHYSAGVIGLNTTAMVETAIVDKPTITWINARYASTQERSGHFHHLSDAGFMVEARSSGEVTEAIDRLLRGEDRGRDARRAFVTDFIRPWGRGLSGSDAMRHALVALAGGAAPARIRSDLERMSLDMAGSPRQGGGERR